MVWGVDPGKHVPGPVDPITGQTFFLPKSRCSEPCGQVYFLLLLNGWYFVGLMFHKYLMNIVLFFLTSPYEKYEGILHFFLYRQSNSLCVPLWIMMVLARDVWSIASMDEQSDLPTFAVSLLFIHLFHLFIRSFIYSIIYPFIHLLLYWMVHLLTLTSKFHQHISIFILIHSSIHSFLHIMDNVHTHTNLHLCMQLLIYSSLKNYGTLPHRMRWEIRSSLTTSTYTLINRYYVPLST